MGLKVTKSPLTNADYGIRLSSTNSFYRGRSAIQGDFSLKTRVKLRVERKIRLDLIGQLIKHPRSSQLNDKEIFFTYSFPLVTSHENGMARIIHQQQQITYPFLIPLGINLPPSCELKDFSIVYYLDIYHDEKFLPNSRKKITLAPPAPRINIPPPCTSTDPSGITTTCHLQKSFYSARDGSIVPLTISIENLQSNRIRSLTIQLVQTVLLNEIVHENEIFTTVFDEIELNLHENRIETIAELTLPSNLPSTSVPDRNCQPDNVPLVSITYEFRLTKQIDDINNSNVYLPIPIGIE
ncbi:unnamed protein product [Adineta ricciae]|uniref:Arrestin C-terminal-like domain-containing protein n=1 Tax=Adineta ricciae TaxID=249248 RepID=A0A814LKR3_ADIRI|nr:unnamed protein product [Adineta ricciae]CAF1092119.1 unnamed protein product [Adineta ricciae]